MSPFLTNALMPLVQRGARALRSFLIPVALVAMTSGATAQSRFRTPDVTGAIDRATAGLDISASQKADLDRIAARYSDNDEPGVLWRVADEVRAVLTPSQIEQLQERPRVEGRRRGGEGRMERRRLRDGEGRTERRRQRVVGEGARRSERRMDRERHPQGEHRMQGDRVHRMEHGVAEEHREAARALHERHREQMEELRAQHESGALDREAFRARADALRDQRRSELQPLLTDEARRMRAEMTEVHERMQAVRDDVLRLTPEQRAAFGDGFPRGRAGGDALAGLSTEQRATMAVFHALMRSSHGPIDARRRTMVR